MVICECTSNPQLLQKFQLSALYTIPTWGGKGMHIVGNFPPCFLPVYKAWSRRGLPQPAQGSAPA